MMVVSAHVPWPVPSPLMTRLLAVMFAGQEMLSQMGRGVRVAVGVGVSEGVLFPVPAIK